MNQKMTYSSVEQLVDDYQRKYPAVQNMRTKILRTYQDSTEEIREERRAMLLRFKALPESEFDLLLDHIIALKIREAAAGTDPADPQQATGQITWQAPQAWAPVRGLFQTILRKNKMIMSDRELFEKLQAGDPQLRLLMLQHVQDSANHKPAFAALGEFALKNNIAAEYFRPAYFTEFGGKSSQVDEAIRLMFQGNSMSEIESRTGVEEFLLVKLKTNETGQQLHQIQLRQVLENDAQAKIKQVQAAVLGKQKSLKQFTTIELRSIDFLKKENIPDIIRGCTTTAEIFDKIRPLVVTYIMSALPLQEIVSTVTRHVFSFKLTAQDLFDLVLMNSEPDARALILDSYSEFYPVPLLISDKVTGIPELFYEMAYFIKPYKCILSFGFKKAELMKCGKSTLLDEIFCTNFTTNFGAKMTNKPPANTFDRGRIQIQLPRNIDARNNETQWAVIDASRMARHNILKELCKHVTIVCIHILAFEILEVGEMKTLQEKLKMFVKESKTVIILVRDVNLLTASEYEQYLQVTASLSKNDVLSKCQFMPVKSLVHETDQMLEVENFDLAFTFNNSLNIAKNHIKTLLNTEVQKYDMFKPESILAMINEFWSSKDTKHQLEVDLNQVQKVINKINQILKDQIKRVEEAGKANIKNTDFLISDGFLPNFTSYYRIRKYQNQILKFMAQKLDNEKKIEHEKELEEANYQLDKRIDDRLKKINQQMEIMKQSVQSEVHNEFTQILNGDRSVFQIWLLTQRLHRDSKENPIWRRFLLNQDLFLQNLNSSQQQWSRFLNENDLFRLLKRSDPQDLDFEKVNSELSIFDFFRESIVQAMNAEDKKEQAEQQFEHIAKGFNNYLKSGESLELVDGENMRIHDKELMHLMKHFINQIRAEADGNPNNLYVITQIGKQSVGKSFLLNQVFKTKFLNKSGRCTSGINFAVRDLNIDQKTTEKLLILDTEGLGSLDKGNRLAGKELDFDRVMVLFSLTISNALIITLKTEIDKETVEILQVCCWALAKLSIDKNDAPHIFFVLNQQADTNSNNYLQDFNRCIDEILKNDMYEGLNIKTLIHLKIDNFFVLPNAFNKETRTYSDIYDFQVQRVLMNHSFNEKCQDLGHSIIKAIKGSRSSTSKRLEYFMTIAGDSFRMITGFPELIRYKSLDEIKCGRLLRDFIEKLLQSQKQIQEEFKVITQEIMDRIKKIDPRQIGKADFIQIELMPLRDKFQQWSQDMKHNYYKYSQQAQFGNHPDIKATVEQIMISKMMATFNTFQSQVEDKVNQIQTNYEREATEQKISYLMLLKHEKVIRMPVGQRERQITTIYNIQIKQMLNQIAPAAPKKRQDEYMRMFHEHYRLFQMENQDMHKMSTQTIQKDYILPMIKNMTELGAMTQIKFYCCMSEGITHLLKSQIIAGFKGDRTKFTAGSFIKTQLHPQLKGMIQRIERRDSGQSRYFNQDSIAEVDAYNHKQVKREFSSEIKPALEWLIGNREFNDNHSLPMDLQIRRLAEQCPAKKQPFGTKIWDVFMENLMNRIQQEIQKVESQQEDIQETSYGNERRKEIQTIQRVSSVINEMILDINHELQFIGCSINSSARIYLNTLGFFMALKQKTDQMQSSLEAKRQHEQAQAAIFIDKFINKVQFLHKYVLTELTVQETHSIDINQAKRIAKAIKLKLSGAQVASVVKIFKNILLQMKSRVDNQPDLFQLLQLSNSGIDYKDLFQTSFLFRPILKEGAREFRSEEKELMNRIPVRYLKWLLINCLKAESQDCYELIDRNRSFSLLTFNGMSFTTCFDEPLPLFQKDQSCFNAYPKVDKQVYNVLESAGLLYSDMMSISNLFLFLNMMVEELGK